MTSMIKIREQTRPVSMDAHERVVSHSIGPLYKMSFLYTPGM